jgi:hypothetical protein
MLDQIATSPFPSIQPHPALHFPVKQPCTYIEPNRKEKKVRIMRLGFHAPKQTKKASLSQFLSIRGGAVYSKFPILVLI